MAGLLRDARIAARGLMRAPGFTLLVVVTLGLGIGANAAIFALVNEALLRPLPFREPPRLIHVWDRAAGVDEEQPVSPPVWSALAARADVFEGVCASADEVYNLTGVGDPESIVGYRLSAGFFPMLGVAPMLGRFFTEDEDRPGRQHVVVLSHRLWQRRFGSDPAIVGKSLTLSGQAYHVVGVMPPRVVHPQGVELWTPLALPDGSRDDGRLRFLRILARLRPGVGLTAARRALEEVSARLTRERPDAVRGGGLVAQPLEAAYRGDAGAPLGALAGAVALVLLVACVNVAGLALARAAGRSEATAVRVALGAGRARLVREALVEAALLSLAGGGVGLALAYGGAGMLPALFPRTISNLSLPRIETVAVDLRVVLFAFGACVFSTLVSGLAPALHAAFSEPGEALKAAGRGIAMRREGMGSLLVAAEVSLALVLLVGAGLLLRSFLHLRGSGLGFDPGHVLTARILPPEYRYGDRRTLAALHDAVLERVRSLPWVEAAGSITFLPLSGWHGTREFRFEGQEPPAPGGEREAEFRMIDPGYLRAMRIPLRAGRGFDARDRATALPVVLVNEAFVRRFLPGARPGDAVGRRLIVGVRVLESRAPAPREVVGVVGDVRHLGFDHAPDPEIYFPFAQEPVPLFCLAVRTQGEPGVMAGALRKAVWQVDPDQPVAYLLPFEEIAGESLAVRRVSALAIGIFGALALGLAALGVYGLVSQAVVRRTREIGVRIALGAAPSAVVKQVMRRSLGLAAGGALAGLFASLALARLLQGLLVGVTPGDPLSFVAATTCLLGAAGLAAYVPARRAARLDPAAVLRET